MALQFELVTPEKLVLSQTVHSVVVPGSEGEFTVLENHAPVMTTIRDGELRVYGSADAAPQTISIKGGFAEVNERGLTVLAESADA